MCPARVHGCEIGKNLLRDWKPLAITPPRFVGGRLSMCYNAVDRHVDAGEGGRRAVVWDSAITASKSALTYAQLRQIGGGRRRVPH